MAFAYITEFSDMQPMTVAGGLGAVVLWPVMATQQVALGAGSANSAVFNARTRMIRVNVDSAAGIDIATNPVATVVANRMSPNSTEYFGVQPGQKAAFIATT